eukprot:m.24231 g.24231  ORF g.24231 m.24231 type:complete len:55 (-) comp14506_c0_seq1:68-232(-)
MFFLRNYSTLGGDDGSVKVDGVGVDGGFLIGGECVVYVYVCAQERVGEGQGTHM